MELTNYLDVDALEVQALRAEALREDVVDEPHQVLVGSLRLLVEYFLAIIADLGRPLLHKLLQLLGLLLKVGPTSIVACQANLILYVYVLDRDALIFQNIVEPQLRALFAGAGDLLVNLLLVFLEFLDLCGLYDLPGSLSEENLLRCTGRLEGLRIDVYVLLLRSLESHRATKRSRRLLEFLSAEVESSSANRRCTGSRVGGRL